MKKSTFIPFVFVITLVMSCSMNPEIAPKPSDKFSSTIPVLKATVHKTYYLFNPSGTSNSVVIRITHSNPQALSLVPVSGKIVNGPTPFGAGKSWTVQMACATWRGTTPFAVNVSYNNSSGTLPQVLYSFSDLCW